MNRAEDQARWLIKQSASIDEAFDKGPQVGRTGPRPRQRQRLRVLVSHDGDDSSHQGGEVMTTITIDVHEALAGPYVYAATDENYDGAPDSSNRNQIGYGNSKAEAAQALLDILKEEREERDDEYLMLWQIDEGRETSKYTYRVLKKG